jgi:glycosyl transferase family 25
MFNEFTPGELGCFISHIKIWKKMIDNDIEKAIIFEDDCIFSENYSEILGKILHSSLPEDFNIIWIGGIPPKNYVDDKNIKISDCIGVKNNNTSTCCTYSYILSLKGAKLLYNYAFLDFKGCLGVDFFMDEFFKNNNHVQHVSVPFICLSWDELGSDIR